jgi:hypothetical protein
VFKTASYTAVLADCGKHIQFAGAGPYTLTLPSSAEMGTNSGKKIYIVNYSLPGITVAPGSGATLFKKDGYHARVAFCGMAECTYTGTDAWLLTGDLEPRTNVQTFVTKTANYTAVFADCGARIQFSGTGPFTLTLPSSAEMGSNYPSHIHIYNFCVNQLTVAAGSGNTLYITSGYQAKVAVNGCAICTYVGSSDWAISGDLVVV